MTIGKALNSSAGDPYRQQATPASYFQVTDTPSPSVGPANDWQSHRTHSSDATASPTYMRLSHHAAKGRVL